MKKFTIPFSETHQFSSLVDDYLSGDEKLKSFYNLPPQSSSFPEAIKSRLNFPTNRSILRESLIHQYGDILKESGNAATKVHEAIHSLIDENTFTVTTGHQLNLFTGPLYTIYKILTTVKLAQQLAIVHSDKKFVPVFWMAAEDHDFEEINNARIYGKTVTWNRESKGPAGRLNLIGMKEILEEVKTLTADHSELMAIFKEAYQGTSNLSQATRILFHRLFGPYGLVILDGDQAELKKLFVEEMKTDLLTHDAFKNVSETSLSLGENYKIQVQPREINLFYITDTSRNRIVKTDKGYSILNTTKIFSHDEILEELETHPERFSPNVVLRPLFQEKILPNLAYIGGPGELNYWLQYKQMFEKAAIPFPILLLRNCMVVVDASNLKKMAKLGLEIKDLFQSSDYLVLKILENSSEIHVGTEEYSALIQKVYAKILDQFGKLDTSLIATVDAEKQKVLNGLKLLEEKGIRALKKKNENLLVQLKSLKEKLFPGDGLQERTDNFIPFYILYERHFLDEVLEQTDPFAKEFVILVEE